MIGLQEHIIKNNIKIKDVASKIDLDVSTIWEWFRNDRIPNKRLKKLSEVLGVPEEYLNKKVNDISTYKPRKKGFNEYKINGIETIIYLNSKSGVVYECKIDTEDLKRLIDLNYCWCPRYAEHTDSVYAVANYKISKEGEPYKQTVTHLNKLLMNTKKGEYVDHINHDTLDNRKENLRVTSNINNSRNRRGRNKNNKSGYRNVCWVEKEQCYYVQLQINGKNTRLNKFNKDELLEAAEYAEEMRQKYYGEFKGIG